MNFGEILGQDKAIGDLRFAFERKRVPNAYLFVGPQGIGKATAAMVMAALINCEGPKQGSDPCEICISCRKIAHDNHTDIWLIQAEGNTIKIDQIRKLQRMVRFPPQEANMRVVMIDGAEKMGDEASNALLKILEEPPPNNLFILISSHGSRLLPTIISRCQRVSFVPLSKGILDKLLVEKHGMDPVQASLAAGISEGSVGKALELKEILTGEHRRELLLKLPELHREPEGAMLALDLADTIHRSNIPTSNYLDLIRTWFRDLLYIREVEGFQELLINYDLPSVLQGHADIVDTSSIYRSIHRLEEAEAAIQRYVSPLLTLEKLFLEIGGFG